MEPHFQEYPRCSTDQGSETSSGAEETETSSFKGLKKYTKNKDFWVAPKLEYRNLQGYLKTIQIWFSVIIAIFVLIVPETREYIVLMPWEGKVTMLLVESGSCAFLIYVLGTNRLPANYISLVIMRLFMVATDTSKLEKIQEHESRVWKKYRTGYSSNGIANNDMESYVQFHLKNLFYLVAFLSFSYFITKYTKLQFGKMESLALLGTFVSSIFGTLLLVTAPVIERVGMNLHLILCKTWTSFAMLLIFFLLVFLFQRLVLQYHNQLKQSHLSRLQFETIIAFVQIYIILRYIPAIHPSFSMKGFLLDEIFILLSSLIPTDIHPLFWENVPNAVFVVTSAIQNYHLSTPKSMGYGEETQK